MCGAWWWKMECGLRACKGREVARALVRRASDGGGETREI